MTFSSVLYLCTHTKQKHTSTQASEPKKCGGRECKHRWKIINELFAPVCHSYALNTFTDCWASFLCPHIDILPSFTLNLTTTIAFLLFHSLNSLFLSLKILITAWNLFTVIIDVEWNKNRVLKLILWNSGWILCYYD